MVRPIVFAAVISAIAFVAGPAIAFPVGTPPTAPLKEEALEVRLTRSNACKPKYRHKKAAQQLRERAHCK
jgi:hypothetical protein